MKQYFFLLLIFVVNILTAQPVDENRLLQMVSNSDKNKIAVYDSMLLAAYQKGSAAEKKQLLDFFSKNTGSADNYTAARCLAWKGVVISRPPFNNTTEAFIAMQQSISRAVESGDEYLMLQCFELYAYHCMWAGKPETALFYFLKSGELRKKLGDDLLYAKNVSFFGSTGVLLYQMQEYAQAIQYLEPGVNLPGPGKNPHTSSLNTLGLSFQRLGQADSALYWFNKSMESATANNDTVWQAIVKGNIGALYFEQQQDEKALPLLWSDYNTCIGTEANNAANTLHRIALICLRHNKTDSALLLAKRSMQIVSVGKPYNPLFVRNASMALSEVYKKMGKTDSAFFYSDIYHRLNDSINLSVARNRADVVQTKLDFEKTSNSINVLLREKQSEKTIRNLLLTGILLLVVAGWFYFRWQRQQHFSRQLQLLHQKEKAEAAIEAATQQLSEFTQHLVDKNTLIENLQQQLQQQNFQVNEELQQQSILTENDWLRFKEMFEKANPGFMAQLQSAAPGITTAEIRLAALIRLNLGNKHMASMLGIGADAVRKTKSRLRQRLGINLEDGLEEYIKSIPSGSIS